MKKAAYRSLAAALFCLLLASASWAGVSRNPLANITGKKAVVLLFIAHDCPISNSYAPEIKRLCAHYTPKRIAFYLVYSEPDLSPAMAQRHAHEYGFTCPLLLDPKHRLVQKAGATVTPEAAVFSPSGRLLYRGRIDDLYYGYGQRRYAVTEHDLRAALEAALSGRQVPKPRTQAIGCFI